MNQNVITVEFDEAHYNRFEIAGLTPPQHETNESAGCDLKAVWDVSEGIKVKGGIVITDGEGGTRQEVEAINFGDAQYDKDGELLENPVPVIRLKPGERALVPTGLKCHIPSGWQLNNNSRSGMGWRNGVVALVAPGIIDSDYFNREIFVILINHGHEDFEIRPGDRIAQITASPVYQINFVPKKELTPKTDRGGGFGSTGK
jgi:dUTP pyrophosphatase